MASVEIADLPRANTVSNNDILVIVVNPTTLEETRSVTIQTLFSNTSIGVLKLNDLRTPANSTITIEKGTLFYDTDYFYIATANNEIKRIALEVF